ncbi:hypothetical protein [Rosenbergiella epipactidis]|uniref:hypothetical protein n=1 Tax=Rosenbergiella epipactidis TaxID=1544694 RepID=UPI001F4F0B5C|nr:hypothetical protein [Rosenbergiella epipactidis]
MLDTENYDATEIKNLLDTFYDDIYSCRDSEKILNRINNLSNTFHSIGDKAAMVLLFVLMQKLNDLNGIKKLKSMELNVKPDFDELKSYIDSDIIINKGKFDFLNHKKGRSSLGKKKLYISILSMVREAVRNTDEKLDNIEITLVLFINLWELSSKVGRLHEFYIMFCSYLHKLQLNQKKQMVRDLAETSLLLGVKNKMLHYSFYVRMAVYSRQSNIIDSVLSAHLMLHGYNYKYEENELFISKIFLELFISLRNFRLYPLALKVKKIHDELNIEDPYDKHQFEIAMFNMKLLMDDEDLIGLVNNYLQDNHVLEFDTASGAPWLILLSNLKRRYPTNFDKNVNLVNALNKLEKNEELRNYRVIEDYNKAMSSIVEDNKEAVKKGISNIFLSRHITDVNYELTMLQPVVKNLLENSIKSTDFEGILIAHALSSGALGFEINNDSTTLELTPIKKGVEVPAPTIFNDYLNHITDLIEESVKSVFLWIGACDKFCYSVCLKQKKFSLYVNYSFTIKDLVTWESTQTELLAFNDQPNLKSILDSNFKYWSRETRTIIDNLPILTDIGEADNIILFRDVNISYLPPNLIKNTYGKVLADLSPIHMPSTVEVFLKDKTYTLDSNSIKLWAPIEGGDFAINIAFDKISNLFEDDSLMKITSIDPRNDLNKDINIFISHGGKDRVYGFKSISPADNQYFIDESSVFGKGKVAILFICHSGSCKSSMFATKLEGLVSNVLNLGYECVLAPAWSYNVVLTGIWIRNFIDAINDGKNISESTFIANNSVKSTYPGIGAYVAMHLFGNYNLITAKS